MTIYEIKMGKKEFFKYSDKIIASSVSIENNNVLFKTDEATIRFLKDHNISYVSAEKLIKKKVSKLAKHFCIIVGAVIFCLIIYIYTFYVNGINFSGDYIINSKIEEKIEDKYVHFLWFNFLDCDYEELSKEVRLDYCEYEWIEINKSGSKINVVINDKTDSTKEEVQSGNIYAKVDGTVSFYLLYSGQVSFENNQFVHKGDLLIDGKMKEARGIVIGTVFEKIKKTYPKKEVVKKETYNTSNYHTISLFNKKFTTNKKKEYQEYHTTNSLNFNLFNFFRVYNSQDIEVVEEEITYTKEMCTEMLKNEIQQDFNSNVTTKYEVINEMLLLNSIEDNDSFTIEYLVKKTQSLGQFVAL